MKRLNKNKEQEQQEEEEREEEEEQAEDKSSTDYDKRCAFCSKEDPEHRCSASKSIAYCSENCKLQDWKRRH